MSHDVPAGPGTPFRWADGHFAVRLQTDHLERTAQKDVGPDAVTVHQSNDRNLSTIIECTDFTKGDVSSSGDVTDFLAGQLDGLQEAVGITLDHEDHITFRDRPAIEGSYHDPTGARRSAIAVMYGTKRSYLLYGPSTSFDALAGTFTPLA